jgi:flagellar hook-basal body complex protein FliE
MAEISSLSSLIAGRAYQSVASKDFGASGPDLPETNPSVSFHKVAENSFNRLAKMSPDEILSRINSHKASPANNMLSDVIRDARKTFEQRSIVARKALLNEASLTELATTTNAARTTLETVVKLRDNFMEMWKKISEMQI